MPYDEKDLDLFRNALVELARAEKREKNLSVQQLRAAFYILGYGVTVEEVKRESGFNDGWFVHDF